MTNEFDVLVASLDYPMVVITTTDGADNSGCLAGFATQCSIDPPRWIVCVSKANHTHQVASTASTLVVHVLREAQRDVADLFGTESGDDIDKFEHCTWSSGPMGVPVLADTDWFAGQVRERWDAGDHTAFLLDVLPEGSANRHAEPQLGFQRVRDLDAGHDPDH